MPKNFEVHTDNFFRRRANPVKLSFLRNEKKRANKFGMNYIVSSPKNIIIFTDLSLIKFKAEIIYLQYLKSSK